MFSLFTVDIPVGSDNYILANIYSKGFYRVFYEQEIFDEIVKKLKEVSFSVSFSGFLKVEFLLYVRNLHLVGLENQI